MLQEKGMPTRVGIKQFRIGKCLSYIYFDPTSCAAMVIDPHSGLMEEYREFLAEKRLTIVGAVDIHQQKDHNSAVLLLSPSGENNLLVHGKVLGVGSSELRVVSSIFGSQEFFLIWGQGMAFIGDALDSISPESASAEKRKAIQSLFELLPDTTVLFSAHDLEDKVCSLLGHEKRNHPFWRPVGLEPSPKRSSQVISISVEKYRSKLDERRKGDVFIDVREEKEFKLGSISGTENIPLSEIGLHWDRLRQSGRIYVSCQSGVRSARVVRTLNDLGLKDVVNVSGGISSWLKVGFPLKTEIP